MRLYSLLFLVIMMISLLFIVSRDVYPADDSSGSDNRQSQIKQIETDLSYEKEQYLQFDQKEKGLLEQLSEIEDEVIEYKIILKELSENIEIAKGELSKQRETLKGMETSLKSMKNLLNKRLVAFYKYAKRGYLRIFSSTNDLTQLNHMTKYLRVILDKDLVIMRQASKEYKEYRQQVSLIEKKVKIISDMQEEESSKLLSLKSEIEKKVILLSRIHKEKEFYETAVKELGAAAENLKNTIRDLEYKEIKTNVLPTGFAEAKGKLPLPLEGKIEKNIKKSDNKILNALKGIYISGSFGADVRAVFQGRVDYSGQLKGYGQIIVINHGSRFYTISAYLSRRDKSEGEIVEKGELIGQVGETGLLEGSGLYFEMRKGDSNLDPLKWLKVH